MRFSPHGALAAALLFAAPVARAGFTEPTLVLATAEATAAGGVHSAMFTGSFEFPSVIDADYVLELVVFQGTRFVRFPAAGTPRVGDISLLADGRLTQDELDAFRQAGTSAPPAVRIVTIGPDRIRVALPTEFTAGPTTAVFFAVVDAGGVLSNPIDFSLP